MSVRQVAHSKQPVELVGSTVTQNAGGDDCVRTCGDMSITGSRAVSADYAAITINDTTWTSLVAPFSDVLQLSVKNRTGFEVKLNANSPAGYTGMPLEADEERNYNDLDTGFVMQAKAISGAGSITLDVEVLKNA